MNDRLLPLGYSRGVLITSFPGLIKYQGKSFVYYDQVMTWEMLIRLPLLNIMMAFSDRTLYLARKHG